MLFANQKSFVDALSSLPFCADKELPEKQSDFVIPFVDSIECKRVKLSDVAEEYSERVDNPSESEYEHYIGSDCIDGFDFRISRKSPASGVTSTQKSFEQGDYLLVRRSLYGSDFRARAPRGDFNGCCSADILTIREKRGKVAPGYLIKVLYEKGLWDYIVSNSTGGLTRRIKWKQLADYKFDLPPIEKQRELAELLWAANDLKESYKKLIVATDEMLDAKFTEIASGCAKVGFLDVCDFQGGTQPPKKDWSSELREGYVRMLQIRDFTQAEKDRVEYVRDTKISRNVIVPIF